MKIFSWMQNKFNGKGTNYWPNPDPTSNHMMYQAPKEEFCDWPNTLLTIGTFGLKESNKSNNIQGISASKQDHVERSTASEDYVELDKMLRQILMNKQDYVESEKHNNMSLEKSFLDCSGENVRTTDELKESQYQRNVSLVHREENDVGSDSKICGIRKKSLTFLLKKALLCSGGFTANPGLRDPYPLPHVKLERSRMEKVFRAMLNKKIYPQKSNPKPASRKYLDMPETYDDDDDETGYRLIKNKWDKTDSEYIVLEI